VPPSFELKLLGAFGGCIDGGIASCCGGLSMSYPQRNSHGVANRNFTRSSLDLKTKVKSQHEKTSFIRIRQGITITRVPRYHLLLICHSAVVNFYYCAHSILNSLSSKDDHFKWWLIICYLTTTTEQVIFMPDDAIEANFSNTRRAYKPMAPSGTDHVPVEEPIWQRKSGSV
jgi:hypothetical protein